MSLHALSIMNLVKAKKKSIGVYNISHMTLFTEVVSGFTLTKKTCEKKVLNVNDSCCVALVIIF